MRPVRHPGHPGQHGDLDLRADAAVIISFYGGGFATVPAYLRDLFGTYQVGAIHGRLLTAWSAAGVAGPLIVNGVIDARGTPASWSTATTGRRCSS
jgi:hypothetical protein